MASPNGDSRIQFFKAINALERILQSNQSSSKASYGTSLGSSAVGSARSAKQELCSSNSELEVTCLTKVKNEAELPPLKLLSTGYLIESEQKNHMVSANIIDSLDNSNLQSQSNKSSSLQELKDKKSQPAVGPYKCSFCSKTFTNHLAHQHHEMIHNPFRCIHCAQKCGSKFALELHQARMHNNAGRKKQIIETEKLWEQNFTAVMYETQSPTEDVPSVKIYSCNKCPFTTKLLSTVYGHQKQHERQHFHKCDDCSCAFSTAGALTRHRNRLHPNSPLADGISFPFRCRYCSVMFTNPALLKEHISEMHSHHSKLPSGDNEPNGKEENVKKQVGRNKENVVYKCILCYKTFQWESNLRLHLGSHIMSHTCSQCSKRFPDEYKLKYHIKKFHSKNHESGQATKSKKGKRLEQLKIRKKPLGLPAVNMQCPVCDVTIAGKTKLGLHLRLYHPKFEAYKCKECPFKTSKQNGLYAHAIIHRQHEIFKCNHCSASFPLLKSREQHVNSVHAGMTSDLSCDTETTLTPRKAAIHPTGYYKISESLHLERENSFANIDLKCRICSDISTTRSGFELHFETHHPNDKPYICSECPYKCVRYARFANHQKLHTERNSIKCEYCSASFVNNAQKTMHISSVHKNKVTTVPDASAALQAKNNSAQSTGGHSIPVNRAQPATTLKAEVYECKDCLRKFQFSMALKVHQRTAHLVLKTYT